LAQTTAATEAAGAERTPGQPSPSRRWRTGLGVVCALVWLVLVEGWFHGPSGLRFGPRLAAVLLVLLVAGLVALSASRNRQSADRREWLAVAGVLAFATLVRMPAFLAPGSVISSDSAVAGIIAQELRGGYGPPPIYAPGFPYEGTLKPHMTAMLKALGPGVSTPFWYVSVSHAFYLLWIGAVMSLAQRAGGLIAATGAGVFMAWSPRFLTAFSLNNVGQYPEVNALGTLGLALLARGAGPFVPALVLGLGLWQQLVGVYFVLVVAAAALVTPELRRPRAIATGLAGFGLGSYPIWVWNLANEWATFDWFRRGGKNPLDRIATFPDQISRVVTVSLPRMFNAPDVGAPEKVAWMLGLAFPILVLGWAWTQRDKIRSERGRSPALLMLLLLVGVILVFAFSKFSNRGAQRPRYLLPIYGSVAVATGCALSGLLARSRLLGFGAAALVAALNGAGTAPWLRSRADARRADERFITALTERGIRTGYTGFWIGPKYTFLSDGRFVLSGELGPDNAWVWPRHAALVREEGPDAFVLDGEGSPGLVSAFEARLETLGVAWQKTHAVYTIFHSLSRRVTLEDVAGYHWTETAPPDEEG
jgi:hypothetical protein